MGREIKRVALDFDYPLHKTWVGFLNPYYGRSTDCQHCDATGSNATHRFLNRMWYTADRPSEQELIEVCQTLESEPAEKLSTLYYSGWCLKQLEQVDVNALWEEDRMWDFGRKVKGDLCPSASEVNEWAKRFIGHDGINNWVVTRMRMEWMGVSRECEHCGGEGEFIDKWDKYLRETWQNIEPPSGDGWQLWETVSEGSPISPVFKDEYEFSDYLIKEQGYHPQAVENFLKQGHAPSMIMINGDIYENIESCHIENDDDTPNVTP